jgi:hypothetical protein
MHLPRRFKLLRRCWLAAAAVAIVTIAADGLICWAHAQTRAQTRAQTLGSSYTSTAPKQCRIIGPSNGVDDSMVRVCPGKTGWQVLIAEDDLRETVSVGRNRIWAEKEAAAQAWFSPFNSAGNTVEWRMQNGRPFAIIQRWQLDDNADQDESGRPKPKAMLVVTRLPPGPVCHVAYVDVAANPNANELARNDADEAARDFRCGQDAVRVVGASGRAVALAMNR